MAAAQVTMATDPTLEDYSIYNRLSDDQLLQLAIEQSLTDVYTCHSETSQHKPEWVSTLPQAASSNFVSSERENMLPSYSFEGCDRTQGASDSIIKKNSPQKHNLPSESHIRENSHVCSTERMALLTWRERNGALEVKLDTSVEISPLSSAIFWNDIERVLEILEKTPTKVLEQPNKGGWLYLHEAACHGREECLRALVKVFPHLIDKRTNEGHTPLALATDSQQLSCARYLLAAGADPNKPNDLGETCLAIACVKGNKELVELLLRWGAKVSMSDLDGTTPLHEAVQNKHLDICKVLVRAGANMRAKTIHGIEPFFTAAQCSATAVMRLLLDHGANINCQARDGATPLYEAAKNGHEQVVRQLLLKEADPNRTTKSGLTPLHIASKNGHARIVTLLIPVTNKDVLQKRGISPLHLAAEDNREDVMEILLDSGFDVNSLLLPDVCQMYDDLCCTALHFAVRNSNIDAAAMLLEAGADPNVETFNPLLVAVRQGYAQMVSLLVKSGANVNARVPTHPTPFPGVFLYCLRQAHTLKFLLDNGCDARACFSCVYGNKSHPPLKIRWAAGDLFDLDHSDGSQGVSVQFCEMLAAPLYSSCVGTVINLLLDYTGPVELCSRIKELLENNPDWSDIKKKARPSFRLQHLCRLRIRQLVGHKRLRQLPSLPLPGRLIKYLFYDEGDSGDVFSCFGY